MSTLIQLEDKKNVLAVRTISTKVLKDYIKLCKEGRNSPYIWFREKVSEAERQSFSEQIDAPLEAFVAAMQRLEELQPSTWTVNNMKELGTRTITEINKTDHIYETLNEVRENINAFRRANMKESTRQKHRDSMASQKLAKAWMDNGSSKQVFLLLKAIGAYQDSSYVMDWDEVIGSLGRVMQVTRQLYFVVLFVYYFTLWVKAIRPNIDWSSDGLQSYSLPSDFSIASAVYEYLDTHPQIFYARCEHLCAYDAHSHS